MPFLLRYLCSLPESPLLQAPPVSLPPVLLPQALVPSLAPVPAQALMPSPLQEQMPLLPVQLQTDQQHRQQAYTLTMACT